MSRKVHHFQIFLVKASFCIIDSLPWHHHHHHHNHPHHDSNIIIVIIIIIIIISLTIVMTGTAGSFGGWRKWAPDSSTPLSPSTWAVCAKKLTPIHHHHHHHHHQYCDRHHHHHQHVYENHITTSNTLLNTSSSYQHQCIIIITPATLSSSLHRAGATCFRMVRRSEATMSEANHERSESI